MRSGFLSRKVGKREDSFTLVKGVKVILVQKNGATIVPTPDTWAMYDCDELPRPSGTPVEPSAFSMHNTMSGPFYDSATDPIRIRRGPRDLLENDVLTRLPDDLGAGIPIDVGKRGRYKDREKLEKRFREQEDDDPEDWFNDSRNIGRGTKEAPPPRGKIMKFGNSVKDGGRHHFRPSPSSGERPPSLLARLGDRADQRSHSIDDTQAHTTSFRIRGAANHHRNDNGKYPGRHDRSQERYREDRNRKSDRDHRPRYSGGYNR
ncbi:hypothetical protein ID866_2485 [Astraeus odoratus]|nr:hypothetical protein ID866_2485 [Astraeus odoratus]